MKIIIVGCGKIGTSIVESLVGEGDDVVAIDNSQSVIDEIGNVYDIMCVCGNGTDTDTLSEAGVGSAELFIAVTNSDELNMLSCFMAERMGAKHTIARIRNPEYNNANLEFIRKQLGLTVSVNPEWMAAQELDRVLKIPAAVKIETFSGGNLEMVELIVKADTPLDGVSLIELRKQFNKSNFLVCAVQCENEVYVPDGHFVLKAGDKIGLTAATSEIQKILRMLGIVQKSARDIIILGASRIAFYLAKRLISTGNRVKVIDKDAARCQEFARELGDAVVICGDGAEQELLLEEGLDSTDAFVALTGVDELNILISIFAKTRGVPKVIAKVNRNELFGMATNLGLESIVSPRKTVSDVLSRYARALKNSLGSNIETLYKLMDGGVEALEFNVSPDFSGLDIALKDLKVRKNTLIAGIIRGRKAILPTGADSIKLGDRVVIITSRRGTLDLGDILEQ